MFILAGQSNMVGEGDGAALQGKLRVGSRNVVGWTPEGWQRLLPAGASSDAQRRRGIRGPTFGPEISFARAVSRAHPRRRVGIIKVAAGDTGILAWSPTWSREQADRSGDGRKGNLYQRILDSVAGARKQGPIRIRAVLWCQGATDAFVGDLGAAYFDHLRAMIAGLRRDLGQPDLPVFIRIPFEPEELAEGGKLPQVLAGLPGLLQVAQAWVRAGETIPNVHLVVMLGLERWPESPLHYNTQGVLESGRLFADRYLEWELGSQPGGSSGR